MCKVNSQVLNFHNFWNGQENDFVRSSYYLILFKAHYRHSVGVLSACNAFFKFECGIFASQKFHKFTCCLGSKSLNCPRITKICSFLFTLYTCSGNYVDTWPRISQIYRYQPQASSLIRFTRVMIWLLNL